MEESGHINLAINSYEEIFSNFDNRNYSKKALSDDFLNECRNISIEKKNAKIELLLFIPGDKRELQTEEIIKKRLTHHFIKNYHLLKIEKKKTLRKGFIMITIGIILSIINTLLHYYFGNNEYFFMSIILVISEPASWFFLWEGMSMTMFFPSSIKKELEFYKKMSTARIIFNSKKEEKQQ
jgi:hypothetical protein